MRFQQIEGDDGMSRRWTWTRALDLGDWTWDVGLGLAGTERCGGSFWRLLVSCFQGWLAVGGGCLGYAHTLRRCTEYYCPGQVQQSGEREGTSGHGQDLLPPGLDTGARRKTEQRCWYIPNLRVPGASRTIRYCWQCTRHHPSTTSGFFGDCRARRNVGKIRTDRTSDGVGPELTTVQRG